MVCTDGRFVNTELIHIEQEEAGGLGVRPCMTEWNLV